EFICSQSSSPSSCASSSYVPTEFSITIISYTCELTMRELQTKDVSKSLNPIFDGTLASLVVDAEKLVESNQLFPHNVEKRKHLSGIFSSEIPSINSSKEFDVVELPDVIYRNILSLKCAIQQGKLYVQLRVTTSFEELCLNTILQTTFNSRGKPLIQNNFSGSQLIVSSLTLFLAPFFPTHD
ncbi:MAG: hypothetical protein EXX96DRAFT_462161, partial [Benjaminiella poitrasii]